MPDNILVTSHVSRDFLQNAAYFNTPAKVVWEYVSNSIDNSVDGHLPTVLVELRQDEIVVSDNGMGMDRSDLARFFTMHGENLQRKRGRTVRGKFGTGKTAAFGLASQLDIESVKDGRLNAVSLSIEDIRGANAGDAFPVRTLVRDKPVDDDPGTVVTVKRFHNTSMDVFKVIRYVEKQLGRMHSRAEVFINEHKCEYREPPAVKQWRFTASGQVAKRIGEVTMVIKAAPTPLDRDEFGVDVLSNGIWHESTLADVSGDQTNRIFGYVDVPILDDDERFGVPAFDNTRNGSLNRANPAVTALLYWIQESVRTVQAELSREARERRKTEEARRLRRQADKIASVLNRDFTEVMDEMDEFRRLSGRRRVRVAQTSEGQTVLPGEGDDPSEFIQTGQPHGANGKRGKDPIGLGDQERPGPGLREGTSNGSKGGTSGSPGARRSRGVFSIEFVHQTEAEKRSRYDKESRTIFINLDHPQIAAALHAADGSVSSPTFAAVAFEVACVEYAQALQFERIESGEVFDAAEAVYSIGDIIDRLSRKTPAG